ncbi:hypothetical protein [Acidiplasma cupricumulans]|uniref:hypothetical protein n=1 Tax=Acidiplasma cupricumulans TaxID=312540 RepID=UPI00078379C2|nr:hypothetical protein [Acidiplasma cupricumulans]
MGFLENYRICKHAYKNAFAVAREITAKKDRIIVNAIPNRRAIWNHEKAMLYAICKYYGQCGKNLDFLHLRIQSFQTALILSINMAS